jgi:penicillin-binding protein 1C
VGNFDRTPLRDSSGVTGAGPIFHSVMLAAERRYGSAGYESSEIVERPAGLEEATICTLSGQRAEPWCPSRSREWLPAGATLEPCAWHHQSDEGLVTTYPPEYRAWFAPPGLTTFANATAVTKTRPADSVNAAAPGSTSRHTTVSVAPNTLTIANPAEGTVYSIDPTLRREFQALPLRAVTPHPTSVTWLVDGAEIGTSSSEKPFDWPLAVGTHQIEARDADGRLARASVVVR